MLARQPALFPALVNVPTQTIRGPPNSAAFRAALARLDFPDTAPGYAINAAIEFSARYGIYPPASAVHEHPERLQEWCHILNAHRQRDDRRPGPRPKPTPEEPHER